MKPFDLQRAKAGDPIVTRDGRRALFIAHIPECDVNRCVIVHTEGNSRCWNMGTDGKSNYDKSRDLFMAPKKREGWVNLYSNTYGQPGVVAFAGNVWASKKLADRNPPSDRIACIHIEWEE